MSGKIIDLPANAVTTGPETLPWATQGVQLQPNASQQETGWQPYGVGPPPDYRLENYARFAQSVINMRANQTSIYLEYTYAEVDLAGAAVGNNRRITIDGTDIDYADQAGDTVFDVADAFVTLINNDPAVSAVALATAVGAQVQIVGIEAGNAWAGGVAVAVLAGAGTITLTTPATQPISRQDGDLAYGADLVIGAPKLDQDGAPSHNARIIWDKSKSAFYAGKATGAQWDDANRGDGSVNFGIDNTASGANSIAMGLTSSATKDSTIAIGDTALANSASAVAIGQYAQAKGVAAVAIGGSGLIGGAQATDDNTIAIGTNAAASVENAIAIGKDSIANLTSAIAIGNGVKAENIGSVAIGDASVRAVTSTQRGAIAIGAPLNGDVIASGEHAISHGDQSTASADYSIALGEGAIATNRGEFVQSPYQNNFATNLGRHQAGKLVMLVETTDATPTAFSFNSLNAAIGSLKWTLRPSRTYAVRVLCIAVNDTQSLLAAWDLHGIVIESGGTTAVIGAGLSGAQAPTINSGAGTNNMRLTTSGGAGSIITFDATGIAATNFHWTLTVEFAEAGHV